MHNEILEPLKDVPKLFDRIKQAEKKLAGYVELSKASEAHRVANIIDYARYVGDEKLATEIRQTMARLNYGRPDFKPMTAPRINIEQAIAAMGDATTERMRHQLQLKRLLELRSEFKKIESFYNGDIIKRTNKILKEMR
ncbi:hypothetical protein [Hydrogenimonas sp.]